MEKLRINFVDFFDNFNYKTSFIYQILSKHYEVDICENPDYLFCSVANDNHLKYNNCVKIFWTGENQVPDFNVYDYAIGFAHIDFADRYLRLPLYYLYQKDFELMQHKHHFDQYALKAKSGFCSFVVSNNHASGKRTEFYNLLNQYKHIASGGRYMNNIGKPVDNKLEFCQKYKFAIAFENSDSDGYTTEKLIQAFAAKAIPIYWGSADVSRHFNPDAFINCNDYNSFDEVVETVKRIDNDDEAYMKIMHTPALLDTNDTIERKMAETEKFLLHIVTQPKDKAIRTDHSYWGRKYNARLLRRKKSEERTIKGLCERLYRHMFRSVINGTNKNPLLWKFHKFVMARMGR